MNQFKDFIRKAKDGLRKARDSVQRFFTVVINPDIRFRLKQAGHTAGYVFGFVLRILALIVLTAVMTASIVGAFGAIYITHYLNVDTGITLDNFDIEQSSHILAPDPDNPGEYIEVETISGKENSVWVSYPDIPKHIINAAVAIEDKRFFYHDGVDWKRTIGAFVTMFMGSGDGGQFGGSTITQQLIKNLTGDNEVTVGRKIQEIFRALEFEKRYSEEAILEAYLNTIYLGRGCRGILTAARKYYGKELSELTLAECAALVGITNNPTVYDPLNNPKNNKGRQEDILVEMYKQQLISREEYDEAKAQTLSFTQNDSVESGSQSTRSWYVEQAIKDLREDLMRQNGWPEAFAQQYIVAGGLNIYLCVDMNIQATLDRIWGDPACWPEQLDEEPPEAAMMIIDPYTGNVLALTGGREKTGASFNLATQARRQPGSSIKPLTVYSPAMELGLVNPYSPVEDMPVRLMDGRAWPRNSPTGYSGHINVITAVTKSKNTVSVQLLQKLTPEVSFAFARDRYRLHSLLESGGIPGNVRSDIDLSPLALGGLTNGLTVREMTAAYGAFPNGGYYYKPRTYTHVTDSNGKTVFSNGDEREQVISEKTAYYMTQCLTSATSSAGTGSAARLTGNATAVAGKTGTTSANNDRWFAGYTPYYTGVCWYGYIMPRNLGSMPNPAIHLWQQVMTEIHKDLPELAEFNMPGTFTKVTLCRDSGLLPTDACRADPRDQTRLTTAQMHVDDVPTRSCNLHYMVKVDNASGRHLATPYCNDVTCGYVGLMYLPNRFVPLSMGLVDEEYTVRIWPGATFQTSIAALPLPEGYYRPYATASKTADPFNAWCPLHLAPAPPSTEETPPGTDEPPDGGEDPGSETPGGETPDTNEAPDGGGDEGAAMVDGVT